MTWNWKWKKNYLGSFMIAKKKYLIEKGLQKTTLDFCLSYIIIIAMDYCMPLDKMMFHKFKKKLDTMLMSFWIL